MVAAPIRFKGKKYSTIRDLAECYGVNKTTLALRIRSGWPMDEALGLKKHKRTGHGISVVIEGVKYKTIKDACVEYGLDPRTIRARISKGYSPEDAILGNLRGMTVHPGAKSYTYKGVYYPSGSALAQAYGQRYSNVIRRINRGWNLGQALLDAPPPPRFRNFEGHARSINWKNVRETPEGLIEPIPDADGYKLYLISNTKNKKVYVGITTSSLPSRLLQHFAASRKGRKAPLYNAIRKYGTECFAIILIRSDAKSFAELQQQEVAEIAKRNSVAKGYNVALGGSLGTSKRITVNGKVFPSRAAAADHFGVDVSVFNLRLNRLKWSPEEAAGISEKDWVGKAKSVFVRGKQYSSIRKAADAFGKEFKKVYDRYGDKGWTLEQALDLEPPPSTVKYLGQSLIYKKKKYASLAQFAREHDLNPDLISRKMREGKSLIEVMNWIKTDKRAGKRRK